LTFTDGSTETITIDSFRGSAANPVSDEELGDLFRTTAEGHLPGGRADQIIETVMKLEQLEDLSELMEVCKW
jgi:hypothetical protein